MSRIPRMLLSAVGVIALCGVAASAASAVETPFYKLNKVGRLKAAETREIGLKANTNTVLSAAGITITCTKVETKTGSTIIGSEAGEPGTSSGTIVYSGCTVAGNGEPCKVANGGVITTNTLKDELEAAAEAPVKGTKILDLFVPASGNVFVNIKFEGSGCKVAEIAVEGNVAVEILNSKKEVVAYEEHEAEEEFGFIKVLANGTKACKIKASKLEKCTTSSIKAVGVAATLSGTAEAFLTGKHAGQVFGVFGGVGGSSGSPFKIEIGGFGENPGTGVSTQTCGQAVNCATGDETTQQVDTAIGGRGPGLNIVRSYDAEAAVTAQAEGKGLGLWGWGWTGPYEARLELGKEGAQEIARVWQQNGSAITFYKTEAGGYVQGEWALARLAKEGSNYIYMLPTQTKLEFNSEGKLLKETDRNGNATTLTYNESKQLAKVTDSTGRTLTFKYNGEGLVESIKDPLGHVVSYTYTSKGLSSVSIEGKVRWEFGYTAESPHLLSSMTDGRKHTVTREYDGSHRVIKETVAGHERKWKYGENETTITEPNGSETLDTFNAAGEPTKIVQAKGTSAERVTEYEYSGTSYELTKKIDPNKHVTEYGYDEEGNRTSEKDPNGDERKWVYDKAHNVLKETTPEGETTTIKRTEAGEPKVIERPDGAETQKTEFKYDGEGDVTEVIDPLGNKTKYTYDAHGNKESEEDAEGNKRKWKYNEDSQETDETSPRGYATKTVRNDYGLPTKVTDPLGHVTENNYDANQNVESETDGNKHTTKYEYNEENLPIKVTKPNGDTTETGYDAEGQKTSYTDGNKHTWEYKRNLLEQVTEEKNPLKSTWKKTYEPAGNLEKLEDPEKRTTEYAYDETNRLTKVKYSTGSPSEVTYEYNKDGKVTKMKDETGTTENTWDKLDRLTEYKNGAGKAVKYEYSLVSLPVRITYPNGKSIAREYDKDNRLSKVTDWKGHATSFKYDADSRLSTTTFPAESEDKDEYAYNEADQMTQVLMNWKGSPVAGSQYERDGDGQVVKTTEKYAEGSEPNTTTSVLDEDNRLIEYNKHAYTYDKGNNPTKIEGEAGYNYNEADQLIEGPTAKYKYDEDGRRTKLEPKSGEPATTYGYDQAGHLTSTERKKGAKQSEVNESITFDANGLSQGITINGTKLKAAWDTAEPLPMILEYENGAGEEEAAYIYGPENLPIEEAFGTNAIYLHHDQQGSTRLITYWQEGEVVGWKTYGPFGNTIESEGDFTSLAYDGQPTDPETGLVWLGARRYDANTGQFMTSDPRIEATNAPYRFGDDNPENRSDPGGECVTQAGGGLDCLQDELALFGDVLTLGADATALGLISPIPVVGEAAVFPIVAETAIEFAVYAADWYKAAKDCQGSIPFPKPPAPPVVAAGPSPEIRAIQTLVRVTGVGYPF